MTRLDQFRDKPMKNLSGGVEQKLGLVCTLIHEPDLVILDEPTPGVDPVLAATSRAILSRSARARYRRPGIDGVIWMRPCDFIGLR